MLLSRGPLSWLPKSGVRQPVSFAALLIGRDTSNAVSGDERESGTEGGNFLREGGKNTESNGLHAAGQCREDVQTSSRLHLNQNLIWRGFWDNSIGDVFRRGSAGIRSYHCGGFSLQKADVVVPPPEKKRTQEIGDRNVDIFDRELKKKHRDRAALTGPKQDPLVDHVTEQLLDRIDDIKREFPIALSLGGAGESVRRHLKGRGNIQTLYQMDLSQAMLDRSAQTLDSSPPSTSQSSSSAPPDPGQRDSDASGPPSTSGRPEVHYVVGDEELLPFREESLDLVISSLGLHWVNDLPGAMIQARRALKPDGLFLAAMFGGETLKELRIACSVAELEREGGVSPRVSPLVQVRDAGNLLGRASLALPTVDVDTFTVNYPSALELVEHIRSMGEANAVRQRRLVLPRDTALATAAAYQSMFGNEDGSVHATFQVIYMAGWAPHSVQQKPRERGSASVSLEDLAKLVEWKPEKDST